MGCGGRQLPEPATENPLDRLREASSHLPPRSPHAPSHTGGNRKTDALVLGGTVAATFPTKPHCKSHAPAGSPTTHLGAHGPPPSSPALLGSGGPPSPDSPPSVPFRPHGESPCCQVLDPESLMPDLVTLVPSEPGRSLLYVHNMLE